MYATDLRDLWRPGGGASRLTYRRLRVLIDGLPAESRLKSEIRDNLTQDEWDALPAPSGYGPWSHTDHLLAAAVDKLGWLIYATYAINSPKGSSPEEPKQWPRPGVGPVLGKAAEADRARKTARDAAVLQWLRDHQGEQPPDDWDWQAYGPAALTIE